MVRWEGGIGRTRKRVTVRLILASETWRSLAMVVRDGSGYVRICFATVERVKAYSIWQKP